MESFHKLPETQRKFFDLGDLLSRPIKIIFVIDAFPKCPCGQTDLSMCWRAFELIIFNIFSYRWPNGILYYTIDAAFSNSERAVIAAGFAHVEENSCIRWGHWKYFNSFFPLYSWGPSWYNSMSHMWGLLLGPTSTTMLTSFLEAEAAMPRYPTGLAGEATENILYSNLTLKIFNILNIFQ